MLYGDPIASRAHFDVMAAHTTPPSVGTLASLLVGVFKSWWGVFGWFNVVYPDALYTLFTAVSAAALIGLAFRWWRERRHAVYGLLVLWTAVFLTELIAWALLRSIKPNFSCRPCPPSQFWRHADWGPCCPRPCDGRLPLLR